MPCEKAGKQLVHLKLGAAFQKMKIKAGIQRFSKSVSLQPRDVWSCVESSTREMRWLNKDALCNRSRTGSSRRS